MKFISKRPNDEGFTLIELLMVISIISLLASIVISSVTGARQKAQLSAAAQSVQQVANALEIYQINNTVPQYNTNLLFTQALSTMYLQPLIINNLISSLPTMSIPWNGLTNSSAHGLIWSYLSAPASQTRVGSSHNYETCGSQPWGNYTMLIRDAQAYYNSPASPDYDLSSQMPQVFIYDSCDTSGNNCTNEGWRTGFWCFTGS